MTSLVSLPPTRSALAAPFVVFGHELREIARQPAPFFGGLLGTVLSCATLVGAMFSVPSAAGAQPEPPMVIEFIPASAISLGDPEGAVDAAPSEPTAEPAVTEPSDPSSVTTEPLPKPREPKPSPNPNPNPNPNPGSQPSTNPFGDPSAFPDLVGDGDPWAAAVMRALRSMEVPAWAGKISTDKPFAFRLVICKDGRVDKVLRKQSTGDADLDARLEHEILRLDLPPVPSAMAAGMPRGCATLSYQFTWSATGVG